MERRAALFGAPAHRPHLSLLLPNPRRHLPAPASWIWPNRPPTTALTWGTLGRHESTCNMLPQARPYDKFGDLRVDRIHSLHQVSHLSDHYRWHQSKVFTVNIDRGYRRGQSILPVVPQSVRVVAFALLGSRWLRRSECLLLA